MNYFFHEEAREEHLQNVAWYEGQQEGLGARYVAAFDAAMRRICAAPTRFPVEHAPGIRRLRIPAFPINILYRLAGDDVEVLALAPHRRRPGYWRARP